MSSSKRTSQRSLHFESLEIRRALAAVQDSLAPQAPDATAFHSTVDPGSVEAFLRYMDSLEEIQIKQTLPDQAISSAVDRLIAESSPEEFG